MGRYINEVPRLLSCIKERLKSRMYDVCRLKEDRYCNNFRCIDADLALLIVIGSSYINELPALLSAYQAKVEARIYGLDTLKRVILLQIILASCMPESLSLSKV